MEMMTIFKIMVNTMLRIQMVIRNHSSWEVLVATIHLEQCSRDRKWEEWEVESLQLAMVRLVVQVVYPSMGKLIKAVHQSAMEQPANLVLVQALVDQLLEVSTLWLQVQLEVWVVASPMVWPQLEVTSSVHQLEVLQLSLEALNSVLQLLQLRPNSQVFSNSVQPVNLVDWVVPLQPLVLVVSVPQLPLLQFQMIPMQISQLI